MGWGVWFGGLWTPNSLVPPLPTPLFDKRYTDISCFHNLCAYICALINKNTQQMDYRHDLVVRILTLLSQIEATTKHTISLLENGCFDEADYWDEISLDLEAEFETLVLIKEALYN